MKALDTEQKAIWCQTSHYSKIHSPSTNPSCQTNPPGDQDVFPGEELDTPEEDTGYHSSESEILEEIRKVEKHFHKLFSFSYFKKKIQGENMKEPNVSMRQ